MRRSLALTFVSCAQAIASQNSSAHSRTLLRLGSSDLLLDISVSAGSYPSDVFWELSCSINGRFRGATLTGGATFEGSLQSSVGASCSLSMSDSFGDGWNGAEWTGEAGGSSYGPFSVGDGATACATFELSALHSPPVPPSLLAPPSPPPASPRPPASAAILLDVSVSAGSYPNQVSWELDCGNGATLTGGAPFEGSLQSSVGASCSFSMSDSFGDGWNGAEWTGEAGGSSYGPFSVGNGATASATFDLLPHSPSLPLSPPLLPTPSPFRPPPPPFRPPPSPFRPPPPPFLPLESSLHGDIYRHILRAPDSHHRNLTVCLYGIWYSMGWYGMVWYGTVWYGMVKYCTVWHGTVYSIM